MVAVADRVYAQILALRCDKREPQEVRLGTEDYDEIARDPRPFSPLQRDLNGAPTRLFGLPLRRLPVRYAVSVV